MNKNSINRVMLAGFIENDPVQSFTSSGTEVCSFSISTEESFKDREGELQNNYQIHRCVCFGNKAETANKYFNTGQLIYLEGSIKTREPDDNNDLEDKITEISVETFTFLKKADSYNKPVQNPKPVEALKNTPRDEDKGPADPVEPPL